jgi:hypothetical protein
MPAAGANPGCPYYRHQRACRGANSYIPAGWLSFTSALLSISSKAPAASDLCVQTVRRGRSADVLRSRFLLARGRARGQDLQGRHVRRLAIEQPAKFQQVIKLNPAKAWGTTISHAHANQTTPSLDTES